MSETVDRRDRNTRRRRGASAQLDTRAVCAAYRRWAGIYDFAFGAILAAGRKSAVDAANRLPGERVLEVGVGTGLALPRYRSEKRIVGIDLSTEMLARARRRVAELGLSNVEALREVDAEATGFPEDAFDLAVAMFVASVVPHPRRLMTEMRRVVRPGGHILLVNHYAAERGPRRWIEQALAPAARGLGWRPDFDMAALLGPDDRARATVRPVAPLGLFTLVHLPN